MRVITNLLFKVTLSSMILTAPAMINGHTRYNDDPIPGKQAILPSYSSVVIKKFIDHPTVKAVRAFPTVVTASEARHENGVSAAMAALSAVMAGEAMTSAAAVA